MTTAENNKDPNCWVCHEQGSQIFCPKCFLGFHIGCAVRTEENINRCDRRFNDICRQCSKIEKSRLLYTSSHKFKSIDRKMFNSILDIILIRSGGIEATPQIMKTEQEWGMFENVKNFTNFTTVRSKIEGNKYECTGELLFDLRKIEHTMLVEFKESHRTKDITHYISQISRYCIEIDLCPHCIYNHYLTPLGSASICPWGHKLATIRHQNDFAILDIFSMKRYSDLPLFYPAKVIAYSKCRNLVHVRLFFSERPWSLRVPIENVMHLSNWSVRRFRETMENCRNRAKQQDFRHCIEKLEIHLQELKRSFGERSSLTNFKQNWKFKDEIFIDCLTDSLERAEKLPNGSKNSNSDWSWGENINTIQNKSDLNGKKRSPEIDYSNSSKKLAKEKPEKGGTQTCAGDKKSSNDLPKACPAKAALNGKDSVEKTLNSKTCINSKKDEPHPHPGPKPHEVSEAPKSTFTGPLPAGWEERTHSDGRVYFVDHNNKKTQWEHPRFSMSRTDGSPPSAENNTSSGKSNTGIKGPLPNGWEKRVHSSGRILFLDHINKKAQWEDPRLINPAKSKSNIVTSVDPGSNKSAPSQLVSDTKNGARVKLSDGNNEQVTSKDQTLSVDCITNEKIDSFTQPNLKSSGENELLSSLSSFSNAEMENSSSLLKNLPEKNGKPEIRDAIRLPEKAKLDEEVVSKDTKLLVSSFDDDAKMLSPVFYGHHRFEITESDEEIELDPVLNHFVNFECQLHEMESGKPTEKQNSILLGSSFNETEKCDEKYSENLSNNHKTQLGGFDASNGMSDTPKKGFSSDRMEQINGAQELEKIINVLKVSKLKLSEGTKPRMFIETCRNCQILEVELDRIQKLIPIYQDNCEILLQRCRGLEKHLENQI
ncbi:uncharacterized protein LOC141851823 [Brevipalpus obovatus]|uniref:uncharacterized protein LOC141851823 n=1 Tax=Brevipalpus obovatus TaxID=246614 RepID=UPI003D9F63EB